MPSFFSAGLFGPLNSEADSKLVHRWLADDVGSGTLEDEIGSADGTVNGVASVSGDWVGGSAGDGDGSSAYVDVGTLGSWGSNLSGTWAIALSISTTDDTGSMLGRGGSEMDFRVSTDDSFVGTAGFPQVVIRDQDSGGDYLSFEADIDVSDGSEYRLVINKTGSGSAASNFDWWVNQTEQPTTANSDAWDGATSDFAESLFLWATNSDAAGGVVAPHNAVIDDICFFDSALTNSEIQSYTNPWEA